MAPISRLVVKHIRSHRHRQRARLRSRRPLRKCSAVIQPLLNEDNQHLCCKNINNNSLSLPPVLTEVKVLLPRPSWQLTTITVLEESVRRTRSMSSLMSAKSGGRSDVIGIRTYWRAKPCLDLRDAIMSLSTATFEDCTSSQMGITDPSGVSV